MSSIHLAKIHVAMNRIRLHGAVKLILYLIVASFKSNNNINPILSCKNAGMEISH